MSKHDLTVPGPDFIGIGVQRSGTTWLDKALRSHPQIWLPPLKELHAFDSFPESGLSAGWLRYRVHLPKRIIASVAHLAPPLVPEILKKKVDIAPPSRWDLDYFLGRRSFNWYARLFTHAPDASVSGEITPCYSILPPSLIAQVADRFSRTKFLLILREPVSRAWSQFTKAVKRERVGEADVEARFSAFWHSGSHCGARGLYLQTLERWRAAVEPERLAVLYYDQLEEDPQGFFDCCTDFLGVDRMERPAVSARTNSFNAKATPPPPAIRRRLIDFYEADVTGLAAQDASPYPAAWLRSYEA